MFLQRSLGASLAGLVLVCLSLVPVRATAVGQLNELVPWPMMCAAITGSSLDLVQTPGVAVSCTDCSGPVRYGVLALGDGTDAGASCAVLESPGTRPFIRIDTDNDHDLSDNPWLPCEMQVGARAYQWRVTVMVRFTSGGVVTRVPYRVGVYAEYSYETGKYDWYYAGYCYRQGSTSIEGSSYAVGVLNMTTTGTYGDLSKLLVAIDIDRDGVLDTLPGSPEVFGPGELLTLPTGTYRVSSVSNDGLTIQLDREGDPVPRPIIARGEPAPAFSTTDLDGNKLSVPDGSSWATVLVLVPQLGSSTQTGACTTCSGKDPSLRPGQILNAISGLRKKVTLVVVSGAPVTAGLALRGNSSVDVRVVYDPAINTLYRRLAGAFVIDRDGTIVAMDEFWSTIRCGEPFSGYTELRGFDIRGALVALLRH